MDNLPGIFRINRVNKAIVSLAERIASAQKIAESIPQITTAVLNLQDEDESQSVSAPTTNPSPQQETDLQLGAIFPNTLTPNGPGEDQDREVILVVDKGEVDNCYITDKTGVKQEKWRLQVMNSEKSSDDTQKKAYSC